MKKLGLYTARGIVTEDETTSGNPQKITLFDGRFDTAYRITDFRIWSADYSTSSTPDVIGKLSKNALGTTAFTNFMRADDDNQIAWAASAGSAEGGLGFAEAPVIDRDNMVVEDLYVYVRGTTAGVNVNYLIEMEKYQITESEGALLMARDRADGE